jgi:ABC-2 type transport system permease protein
MACWLYLLLWSCVAMTLASLGRRPLTGLLASLVVWLAVVLIIPQVGDTMDPDNQIPGGLFRSLQIAKDDEYAVVAHFAAFDAVRNGLEVSSVTKHFERATFAYLGIKETYNQQPLGTVWSATLVNILALTVATAGAVVAAAGTTSRGAMLGGTHERPEVAASRGSPAVTLILRPRAPNRPARRARPSRASSCRSTPTRSRTRRPTRISR